MMINEELTKEEIKQLLRECEDGLLFLGYKDGDGVVFKYAPEILALVLHAAEQHARFTYTEGDRSQ
jgi:hypothetical protein